MSLQSILSNSWRILKGEGVGGVARSLVCRAKVRINEYRYGIRTEGVVTTRELGFETSEYHRYSPSDYHHFSKVLADIDIRAGCDSFLDFGAGRGRVMIVAARCPFKRVLGVEISPELATTARENFSHAMPRLCCKELEIFCQDAAQFNIPPDVTVVFFFNPFHGTILDRVFDNLQTSLRERPRSLTVICNLPPLAFTDQLQFEHQIRACSWLKLCKERSFGPESRWLIFSHANNSGVLERAN
jgi:hypothetical protein